MTQRPRQFLSSRRARDRSTVLLALGIALLVSPMAGIFQLSAKLGGIPVTLIYLFAVWALLILGALLLSNKLSSSDSSHLRDVDPEGRDQGQ